MLISKATRKIDLPHEEGEWIEVRDLTRKEINEARRLKTASTIKDFKDIMEMFAGREIDPTVKQTTESFDIDYVLETAIVGWSYGEFNQDDVARLDRKTAEYVARDLLGIEEEGERVKG